MGLSSFRDYCIGLAAVAVTLAAFGADKLGVGSDTRLNELEEGLLVSAGVEREEDREIVEYDNSSVRVRNDDVVRAVRVRAGLLNASDNCVRLIKGFEKFSPVAYPDNRQVAIGYGHRILPEEEFARITENRADELLYGDLGWAEEVVSRKVKVPLSQNQYDALCSFVFNVGSGYFSGSTLLEKLNGGDYVGAANEFKRWDGKGDLVIPGLARRRVSEVALFRK